SPDTTFSPTANAFIQTEPNTQDFVLWSFFNTLFCNAFCLGFIALSLSIKARDRKIAQDHAAASAYGRSAKTVNIIALCVGILVSIISIVVVVMYLNAILAIRH
ncbi:IFM3 protein, partial [Steatornis caripensis]|nr:IFM3 protein [Steatornis caripensis]